MPCQLIRKGGYLRLDTARAYLHTVDMETAKLFRHGGSQAVRLPKAFRFEGTEVTIERRGRSVILTPHTVSGLKTLGDVARHLKARYPGAGTFPSISRTRRHQRRALDW